MHNPPGLDSSRIFLHGLVFAFCKGNWLQAEARNLLLAEAAEVNVLSQETLR